MSTIRRADRQPEEHVARMEYASKICELTNEIIPINLSKGEIVEANVLGIKTSEPLKLT